LSASDLLINFFLLDGEDNLDQGFGMNKYLIAITGAIIVD